MLCVGGEEREREKEREREGERDREPKLLFSCE